MPAKRTATRSNRSRSLVASTIAAFALLLTGVSPVQAASTANTWMPEQIAGWATITKRTSTAPLQLTNGVEYSEEIIDSVEGHQPINIVTADTNDPNVAVRTVSSHDRIIDPENEAVSSMANRTGAIAGVNGGYFRINASGQPNLGYIAGGEIWKSPAHDQEGTFSVLEDGSIKIGKQEFSGTITGTQWTHALDSINWIDRASEDQITLITPRLGEVASTWLEGEKTLAVGASTDGGKTIQISEVKTVDALDQLPEGTYGLLAGGPDSSGAKWLHDNAAAGSSITTESKIAPNNDIAYMVQGPGRILQDGEVFDDPNHQMPSLKKVHPETAAGIDRDGKLVLITFDGGQPADTALGVNWKYVANYLKSLGITDAVLLDGGGSSTMVTRVPGDTETTVANTPATGGGPERPVSDGIFLYSTATEIGSATSVHLNGNEPLQVAAGAKASVSAFAADSNGNPTGDTVDVSVAPESLGSWENGTFTAKEAGTGTLTASVNGIAQTIDVEVISDFDSLAVSPDSPRVDNGDEQQLTLVGIKDGQEVALPAGSVEWSIDNAELGEISKDGRYVAAEAGAGVVTVTAALGDQKATTQISSGSNYETIFVADDPAKFKTEPKDGATTQPESGFVASDDVPEGSDQSSSVSFDFSFPNDRKQHSVTILPDGDTSFEVPQRNGIAPTYVYFTVKIENDAENPQPAWLVNNLVDANGQVQALWSEIGPDQYNKWITIRKKVRWGKLTEYPLHFSNIRWVGQNAKEASSGTFKLAKAELSYPPSAAEDDYEPIASGNPDWLQYENSAEAFKPGGTTYIMGDDGHLIAAQPESSSAVNVDNMVKRTKGETYTSQAGQTVAPLAEEGRPEIAVSLGDISDTGDVDNLQFAKDKWEGFGVPLYDVVGNHEVSQGALPADGNFYDVFGQDTHFSFVEGNSTFISVDSSRGGVTASQSQQVPDEYQYGWFVNELESASTKTVFIATHWPAYDPLPNKSNQFQNRWEAQQFLQIIDNYKQAHPDKRVVVFYGHSRGFASQFIDPMGRPGSAETGIPQFTVADIGTPPYTAPDKGGFYHFALFHVNPDGTVQYTVEPLLQSVEIDQGDKQGPVDGRSTNTDPEPLPVGDTRQYTATAINTAGKGDNNPPVMPVQAPLSHVWSSSDPQVATVDPVTGEVTALAKGATTISVTTGGITAEIKVEVSEEDSPTPPSDGQNPGDNEQPGDDATGTPIPPGETGTSDGESSSAADNQAENNGLAGTGAEGQHTLIALTVLIAGLGLWLLIIRRKQGAEADS